MSREIVRPSPVLAASVFQTYEPLESALTVGRFDAGFVIGHRHDRLAVNGCDAYGDAGLGMPPRVAHQVAHEPDHLDP